MSSLLELVGVIADAMVGAGEISRNTAYSRNTDIGPFIEHLEASAMGGQPVRCGDDALCLGEAIMVFAVEPLVTLEGRTLADVAVQQLDEHGVRIDRVGQPFERVLSVIGTSGDGLLEGRIIASRGWVFLVTGPERDVRALSAILDASIAGFEGTSTR
jgi:hypothetical protein